MSGMITIAATSSSTSSRGSGPSGVESGCISSPASATGAGSAARATVSVMAHHQPLVADGDDGAEDEQHHADRRAEADPHPPDAEIVEERDDGMGGVERTAAGQRH